ncbi:unnamed protein product [Clonostachys solani]|uniref:Kinesin light chain n=1 Tax=Clonostachys solani TaxID=160281 RepID=A0A9N9ZAH9_9HYPO|nr:unnamed protein product [Clonostachys solani]
MRDDEKAETTYKEIIRVQRRELGAEHPHTLDTMSSLASFLIRADRMPAAETMLQDVIVGRQQALGESHPDTIESMDSLRDVLSQQGKFIDATGQAEKIVELQKKTLGEEHDETLGSMIILAVTHAWRGEYLIPMALCQQVIKTIMNTSDGDDGILRLAVLHLVELLYLQGKFEEAELACRDVFLHIAKSRKNPDADVVQFKASLINDLHEAEIDELAAKFEREVDEVRSKASGS